MTFKGQDALDYVRYGHGDNDFFRASRHFIRQITHQDSMRKLLDFSNKLASIFGHYFEVDKAFLKPSNLLGLARTAFLAGQHAPVNEVRFPAYESPTRRSSTRTSTTSATRSRRPTRSS